MNGIVLIDKPKNMTSRDVVNIACRIFKTKKIGHTGTLDPIATGVLVLCIGSATKICELITNYDKEYEAEITLGIETDTLDTDGVVINEENVRKITKKEITDILATYIGEIEQEVPKYSAIKVDGKKLYEYARKNIDVELPVHKIKVYKLEMIGKINILNSRQVFRIRALVSKGTYIRSLIRDICRSLGTIGVMSELVRTKQGPYKIEECIKLEGCETDNFPIISIRETLNNMDEIIVDKKMEILIRHGNIIKKTFSSDYAKIITLEGEVIAIYKNHGEDSAKPFKMLS